MAARGSTASSPRPLPAGCRDSKLEDVPKAVCLPRSTSQKTSPTARTLGLRVPRSSCQDLSLCSHMPSFCPSSDDFSWKLSVAAPDPLSRRRTGTHVSRVLVGQQIFGFCSRSPLRYIDKRTSGAVGGNVAKTRQNLDHVGTAVVDSECCRVWRTTYRTILDV